MASGGNDVNGERPWDFQLAFDGHPPDSDPDDFEILLFGGDGPELTMAQAERNTEVLTALTAAARDCGVVPRFLQLPAAPPAPFAPAALQPDPPPFDEAYCLRMGLRTRRGFPLGRTDFLNAVLRLAGAYGLGMYVGETSAGESGTAAQPQYQRVLPYQKSSRPAVRPPLLPSPPAPRRAGPLLKARHRVIDLTALVPVPARAPLDGSLMVTVVGPLDFELAADLARIALFFDDHRVGCHAASASMLEQTIVVNLVLVVLPDGPVGTDAFAEILRSGLGSDPLWPSRFRPTLLDPVATR
jgi:hypothetical protein